MNDRARRVMPALWSLFVIVICRGKGLSTQDWRVLSLISSHFFPPPIPARSPLPGTITRRGTRVSEREYGRRKEGFLRLLVVERGQRGKGKQESWACCVSGGEGGGYLCGGELACKVDSVWLGTRSVGRLGARQAEPAQARERTAQLVAHRVGELGLAGKTNSRLR